MTTELNKKDVVLKLMQEVLEQSGFEITEDPDAPGWSWATGESECEEPFPSRSLAVFDAWWNAAEFVRDTLASATSLSEWRGKWMAMGVRQQAKLILLCFGETDEDTGISEFLFEMIRENDTLKMTLNELGKSLEAGDAKKAMNGWQRAKQNHRLDAYH